MVSFTEKTREELGKYIRKPVLTEKLLLKPPFRFIFDIISVVIKQHGLFDGLFKSTELIFENVSDKESKKVFLDKVFKCLGLALGKEITCRPAKLIAGLDPESTNLFLQDLAFAISNKVDTKEAVRIVLNGSRRSSVRADEKKEEAEISQSKIVDNGNIGHSQIKPKVREKDGRTSEQSNNKSTKKQPVSVLGTNSKLKQNEKVSGNTAKKVPQKLESARKSGVKQLEKVENGVVKVEENRLEKDQNLVTENGADVDKVLADMAPASRETVLKEQEELKRPLSEKRPESHRPQSVKGRLRTPLIAGRTFVVEEKQAVENESNFVTFEQQLPRQATVRPPTARVKNVIVSAPPPEEHDGEPEEDEEIKRLIELAEQDSYDLLQTEHADLSEMGHGKLVDTIIATQKELVGDSLVETQADTVKASVQERRKEREVMQNYLQELTRSLRPLLRLMESAQEDSVIMRRELKDWQEKRQALEEELELKRKHFEESVSPLREELSELQEDIDYQQRKIHAIRIRMFDEARAATEMLQKLHAR